MNTSRLLLFLAIAGALASLAGSLWLARSNRHLRLRIAEIRQSSVSTLPTREAESRRAPGALITRVVSDENASGAEQRTELARTRADIAALERQAAERRARADAAAAQLAANRDARQSPVLLTQLQNRGQATPTATFETLIWATITGDAAVLAGATTMTAATRRSAEELIARLPPEARAHWTPEQLATLWLTDAANEMRALQITGEIFTEEDSATVTFRPLGQADDEKINLKLTPSGWKVIMPGDVIKRLERKLERVGR